MYKSCPRCNSKQKFSPRKETDCGMTKVYIKCSKCKWVSVIEDTPSDLYHERYAIKKLKHKAKKVPALNRVIEAKRRKIEKINSKTD